MIMIINLPNHGELYQLHANVQGPKPSRRHKIEQPPNQQKFHPAY